MKKKLLEKDGFYLALFVCICLVAIGGVWFTKNNVDELTSNDLFVNKTNESSKRDEDEVHLIEKEAEKEKNEEKFNETKPLKDSIPSNDLNSISEPTIGKGTTVYVTDKGKCYHFKKCRRGSNYHAVTLEEAEEKGLKPCKKCTKQS